jgi:hypothetical protein
MTGHAIMTFVVKGGKYKRGQSKCPHDVTVKDKKEKYHIHANLQCANKFTLIDGKYRIKIWFRSDNFQFTPFQIYFWRNNMQREGPISLFMC